MRIIKNLLEGVKYDPAKEIGSVIVPKFLVQHYTAGYTLASARSVFKTTIIAAHIIIDRDGTILQMVPFDRKANHAGPSSWMGVQNLNGHSIGIEYVNIGYAKMRADGRLVDAYGGVIKPEDAATYIEAPNARVGSGRIFWQPYTEAQILAGIEVTKAILDTYQIRDIVSHEEIDTRGWKTDPGPAFPMNRFTALMRGNSQIDNAQPLKGMVGVVTTATLNIRGGPSAQFPVIGQTSLNSRLGIIDFKDGWYQIHTTKDGAAGTGWVSASYVKV